MDEQILQGIGLSKPQANTYLHMLNIGEATPPQLAKDLGQTRTNMYSVLDQLSQKGLAKKLEKDKKITYIAAHPVQLEKYVEHRRNYILNWEYKLNSILPQLVKNYYSTTEQPEVRFFQGKEALKHIYGEVLRDKQPVHVIECPSDHDYLGEDFVDNFVRDRVKAKIKAYILSPKHDDMRHNLRNDKVHLIERYWYSTQQYNSPVEITIFGDKVAYLSFGEEVIGTIMHSPQIAQSQRELFMILAKTQG